MAQQTENTKKLMRRLAGSLVSWLTFQQAALRSRMYNEYWMYPPIFEVASARGWKIRPQFPLKVNEKNTIKYVDFVFYGNKKRHVENDRVAAVEISYIRKNTGAQKISKDECKLKKFRNDHFRNGKLGAIKRYVLIAGKEDHLRSYCNSNFQRAMPLFKEDYSGTLGWRYSSPSKFPNENLWCVMVVAVPAP